MLETVLAPGLVVRYLNRNVRILEIDQEYVHIKMPTGAVLTVSRETLTRYAQPLADPDAPPLPEYKPENAPVRDYKATRYGTRYTEELREVRCYGCGTLFMTNDTQKVRCIRDCGRSKEVAESRKRRGVGRIPERTEVCVHCEKPFQTNRLVKKYCSVVCRRAIVNRKSRAARRGLSTDNQQALPQNSQPGLA